jgi:CNH domain
MPDSVLNIRQGVKHICTYRIESNEHLVCYDGKCYDLLKLDGVACEDSHPTHFADSIEYAFYIDGKGRRKRSGFLIEWEGQPESFAFSYPYVLAFEPNFIEIRHMLTVSIVFS